ncbi:MAG: transcription antitermination factor NusB [Ruminococcaceae bacterium]|nr:transcription antitermination factor NusB [Oscillospiraceae bacterium]
MTRTTAREIAVHLGFSLVMSEQFADELMDEFFETEHYESLGKENPLYAEFPDETQMNYIRALVQLIFDHRVELDAYIEKYAKGWKIGRISKTAAAIMRCAMAEILYMPDVPDAAAINEAVELAKGYEDEDVVAFINGVLGGFMRGEVENKEN